MLTEAGSGGWLVSSVSWTLWAKTVPGLTATQRIVLAELAELADAEGAALASVRHLQQVSGRTSRSVYSALAKLEERGLIVRKQRFDSAGGQQSSLFYLRSSGVEVVPRAAALLVKKQAGSAVANEADAESDSMRVESSLPAALAQRVWNTPTGGKDSEDLFGEVLDYALAHSWTHEACHAVGVLLNREASSRFGRGLLIARSLGYKEAEALTEVVSLAWRIVFTQTRSVARARSRWAYLAKAVEASIASALLVNTETALDDETLGAFVEKAPLVEADTDESVVSLAALGKRQKDVIAALTCRGMSETVATAVTLRLLEIAVAHDVSRRVFAARTDLRLGDWGITPEAAVVWLSAVAATRAKKLPDIDVAADEIMALLFPDASAA